MPPLPIWIRLVQEQSHILGVRNTCRIRSDFNVRSKKNFHHFVLDQKLITFIVNQSQWGNMNKSKINFTLPVTQIISSWEPWVWLQSPRKKWVPKTSNRPYAYQESNKAIENYRHYTDKGNDSRYYDEYLWVLPNSTLFRGSPYQAANTAMLFICLWRCLPCTSTGLPGSFSGGCNPFFISHVKCPSNSSSTFLLCIRNPMESTLPQLKWSPFSLIHSHIQGPSQLNCQPSLPLLYWPTLLCLLEYRQLVHIEVGICQSLLID